MEEDGDSVVSTPPVADRFLISIVTFIYANNLNLVLLSSPPLALLCRFGAYLPVLPFENSLVRVSISLTLLLRL